MELSPGHENNSWWEGVRQAGSVKKLWKAWKLAKVPNFFKITIRCYNPHTHVIFYKIWDLHVLEKNYKRHVTCDMWHLTRDNWHMTCDTWHMTLDAWYLIHDKWQQRDEIWHMTLDRWHLTPKHEPWHWTPDKNQITHDTWLVGGNVMVSRVTCQVSGVRRHMSHVTRQRG